MKHTPLALLWLLLVVSILHAEGPLPPVRTTDAFRINIVRVTANRDLSPLAFPTPPRVNGILDEPGGRGTECSKAPRQSYTHPVPHSDDTRGENGHHHHWAETPDAPTEKRLHSRSTETASSSPRTLTPTAQSAFRAA